MAFLEANGVRRKISLVVFDKDGLMFKSQPFWAGIGNERMARLKEYMTEHGFNEVVMGRSLYRLEYLCKQKGDGWRCFDIEVTPASEPGYYSYQAALVEEASGNSENLWITGNYYAGEDGLVDNFFIDLSGEIMK